MSTTFSTVTNRPLRYGDIAWREADDLVLASNLTAPPAGEPLPESGPTLFFRRGRSTQGVTVRHDGHRKLVAELGDLAAPEDYAVAFHVLERAARIAGSPIVAPERRALPPSELRKVHDEEWVRGTVEQGVRAALDAARDKVVTVPGALRPFCLGPNLAQEVVEASAPGGVESLLLDRMRAVQAIHASGRYAAVPSVRGGSASGHPFTYVAWGPGLACLVPDVQYLAIVTKTSGLDRSGSQPVFIRAERAGEVAGGSIVKMIDERQMTIEAVMPERWPALVAKARGVATLPLEKADEPSRRWWEVWKR